MVFSNPDQWSVKHGLYNKDHLPLFNCFAGAQKALTGKKIQTPFIDPQLRTKHNDEGTPNQSPFSFISDGKKSLETQAASMTNANITADELWAEKSTVRNKACVSPPKEVSNIPNLSSYQHDFQNTQFCFKNATKNQIYL